MTEISEAAKAKALELTNAADCDCKWTYTDLTSSPALSALAAHIQQVSDAALAVEGVSAFQRSELLAPFILTEPVDPLYEALFAVVELGRYDTKEQTELLRGELAKRGLKIVEATDANG